MCFDFFAPSILPPTPRARKYVFNMKALLWTHVSFAVIKLFFGMLKYLSLPYLVPLSEPSTTQSALSYSTWPTLRSATQASSSTSS